MIATHLLVLPTRFLTGRCNLRFQLKIIWSFTIYV